MTWLSRLDETTPFLPDIALPLVLLGVGMGGALAPLTAAGIAGVDRGDAGAASGVVNAAQQLGVSLGVSVLVTVVAAAGGGASQTIGLALHGPARAELAQAVATALTGSAVLLALGLAVIVAAVRRPSPVPTTAPVLEVTR
jgi:hypothetical protein